MTFRWIAKQLSGRRGPVKGPGVGAAVGEGEGDQGRGQGLQSLLGELLWQRLTPQEAAAAPAQLLADQRLPIRLTRGRKGATMTLILFASTFPGNKRREKGVKQKRRGHWGKMQRGETRDWRSSTGSKDKWLKQQPFPARHLCPLYNGDYRRPTTNCCWRRLRWAWRPHRRNLLLLLVTWYFTYIIHRHLIYMRNLYCENWSGAMIDLQKENELAIILILG